MDMLRRNTKIRALRKSNMTLEEIADIYQITKQRVDEICEAVKPTQAIYIPDGYKPNDLERWALAAHHHGMKLSEIGRRLKIATKTVHFIVNLYGHLKTSKQDTELYRALKSSSLTIEQIAAKFDVPMYHVAGLGKIVRKSQGRPPSKAEIAIGKRNSQIYRRLMDGERGTDLAVEYGLSNGYISQIKTRKPTVRFY